MFTTIFDLSTWVNNNIYCDNVMLMELTTPEGGSKPPASVTWGARK